MQSTSPTTQSNRPKKFHRAAWLAAALIAAAGCAPETGADDPNASADGIIGGTRDTGDPAVVAVFSSAPGARTGYLCTGTLISPQLVLTAGHCVAGSDVASNAVFHVFTASDITVPVSPSDDHAVHAVHPHPNYDRTTQANDIAIVELQNPITNITPMHFLDEALPSNTAGQSVRLIGYGVNQSPARTGAGLKRQVTVTIGSVDGAQIHLGTATRGSCFGDSGGPALLRMGGTEVVAGVASTVNEPSGDGSACHSGDNYTRVDDFRSWIHSFIPTSTAGLNSPTWSQLSTFVSTCNGANVAMTPQCMSAYHRFCRTDGHDNTGFGPVEKSTTAAEVVCLQASVLQAHFSDWDSNIVSCNGTSPGGVTSSACASAVHRHCRSLGYATGFGPVEHSGDDNTIACLSNSQAQVLQSTYTELRMYQSSCDGTNERWGGECNAAIDRLCHSRGAISGFGPVENSGDNVTIACVYAEGASAPSDPCSAYTSCDSCTSAPSCGWCGGAGRCVSGTSTGANGGLCSGSDWAWISSSCSSGSSSSGPH